MMIESYESRLCFLLWTDNTVKEAVIQCGNVSLSDHFWVLMLLCIIDLVKYHFVQL